jgi:glutathione peroxidase
MLGRSDFMARVARALVIVVVAAIAPATAASPAATAHDFSFVAIDGGPLPLSKFAGKAVLVVNTASFCGYTHQYADLQELWRHYRERGLVVLGVPSNDFGAQEPGSSSEIKQFCEVNFDIDFPLTEKQIVSGESAHPFYQWARQQLGRDTAPQWNFHKYLVSPNGRLAAWFPTRVPPASPRFAAAIEAVLPVTN